MIMATRGARTKRKVEVLTKQEVNKANKRCRSPPVQECLERMRPERSPSPSRGAASGNVASMDLRKLLKGQARKMERARKRQRKYGVRARGLLGERSLLEIHSVTEQTRKDYAAKVDGFMEFVRFYMVPIKKDTELDAALCDYAEHLFLSGETCSFGQKLQAALEYVRPETARDGSLRLPRVKRALKGWRKLSPAQCRLPMLEFLKSALSGVFCTWVTKTWRFTTS